MRGYFLWEMRLRAGFWRFERLLEKAGCGGGFGFLWYNGGNWSKNGEEFIAVAGLGKVREK